MKIKANELLKYFDSNGYIYYPKDYVLVQVRQQTLNSDYWVNIISVEAFDTYVEIYYSNDPIVSLNEEEIEIRVFSDITNVIEMSREN